MNQTFSRGAFGGNGGKRETLVCLRGKCTLKLGHSSGDSHVELDHPFDAVVLDNDVSYEAQTAPLSIIMSILSD